MKLSNKHVSIVRSLERNETRPKKFTSEFFCYVSKRNSSKRPYYPQSKQVTDAQGSSNSSLRGTYLACKRFALQGWTRLEARYLDSISAPLDADNDG